MKSTSILISLRSSCVGLQFLLLWLLVAEVQAEDFRYRLYLDGKPEAQLATLSQRSLQRRERQQLTLDSTDYDVSPVYLAALSDAGLQRCAMSRWLNTVVVQRSDGALIDSSYWEQFPFVIRVDQVSGSSSTTVQKPQRNARRDLVQEEAVADAVDYAAFVTPMYELNGQALHSANYQGQGMLIAVIDGGFLNTDLYTSMNRNVVGIRDLYNPSSPQSIFRTCNHGTQVLSVMSTDSAYGVWGTAPQAEYFLIRSENVDFEVPFEEDLWVMGAELADSLGADLINSSLGYASFDDVIFDHESEQLARSEVFISRGAEVAARKGMLLCVAAGNEGATSWETLLFPADVEEVLTVAATNASGDAAYFTSSGFLSPWVKPNVACRGQNAYTIDPATGKVVYASGTSFATPMMCGLAASLWSAAPSLTARQIHTLICQSAAAYSSPDIRTGYGHPDFSVALTEAKRLETASDVEQISVDEDLNIAPRTRGIFDLMGRKLNAAPLHGAYIENGRLKMRR